MALCELQPWLLHRLARLSAHVGRVVLRPAGARFSSAALHLTSDDADEPGGVSDCPRRPDAVYVESFRSKRKVLERFLRRELGLSWARAEHEVARCRLLSAAGLPLMTENLTFLTSRGVLVQHLQDDVDVLGMAHTDLLRVHSLVGRLSDAEYSRYYPLSRAQPAMVDELFVRLATGGSNLVHQLADVLQLPELTVSRAVSRMATQITKSSPEKLLSNARLLTDLGLAPSELAHSLYLLRLSGARLRYREQQCRRHGVPLRAHYLAMSDENFRRRVARGGRLAEETEDVAAAVARRLGVTRQQVLEQTRRSDVLSVLRRGRLEAISALLEGAGYGPGERLSALLTVYRGKPERLLHRLQLCRRLGRPKPSLALLAADQRRFEQRVSRWRREGEHVQSVEDSDGGLETASESDAELESDRTGDGEWWTEEHGEVSDSDGCVTDVEDTTAGTGHGNSDSIQPNETRVTG